MGKDFMMSRKFNKRTAEEFGLVPEADGLARRPEDNTLWKSMGLHDFGWGEENGYCKLPVPSFDELFDIALHSANEEDQYGAAAVIQNGYPTELLEKCEGLLADKTQTQDIKTLIQLFNLKNPVNRCPVVGKSLDAVKRDAARWKAISGIAQKG